MVPHKSSRKLLPDAYANQMASRLFCLTHSRTPFRCQNFQQNASLVVGNLCIIHANKITVLFHARRLRGNLIARCLFLSPTFSIYFSFSAEIASDHFKFDAHLIAFAFPASNTNSHYEHHFFPGNPLRIYMLATHPAALDVIVVLTADRIDSFLFSVCSMRVRFRWTNRPYSLHAYIFHFVRR